MSVIRLSAQSDAFFNYNSSGYARANYATMKGDIEIGRLDVEYVPLNGGVLVMLTCGVLYITLKKGGEYYEKK